MSEQYPGGWLTSSPPAPSGPAETDAAPGIWTLDQAEYYTKIGLWPTQGVVASDPYFEYVTMLLPGNGTNGGQNNTFLDSSANAYTVSRSGNTTQGTFSSYGSNWSTIFPSGSNNRLQIANTAQLDLGTGDFTLECWAYNAVPFSTYSSTYAHIFGKGNGVGAGMYALGFYVNRFYFVGLSGSIGIYGPSSAAINLNQWYHVAVTRSSGVIRIFVDGVLGDSVTSSYDFTSSNTFNIGDRQASDPSANYPMQGGVSNLRVVVGTALYTSNFTPPTAPLTAVANTRLLTCQSNRYIDNSANNFLVSSSGTVPVTRFSPFNPTAAYSAATVGGSAYFDGTDYLTVGTGAPLDFGSGNFTVEFWVYPTKLGAAMVFLSSKADATQTGNVDIRTDYIGASSTTFYISGGGATFSAVFSGNLLNRWTHIALARSGSTVTFYFNGVVANSASGSTQGTTFLSAVNVGGGSGLPAAGYEPTTGWIAGLRVVKGSTVYTGAFTPPTSPPTAVANTSLLMNFTNASIIDNAMMNDLETVGNAQISTAQSKFGGSSISFNATTSTYLSSKGPSVVAALDSGDFTIEFWVYFNTGTVASRILLDYRPSSTEGVYPTIYVNASSQLIYYTSSSDRITGGTLSAGSWIHIALCRANGNTKLFINGTQSGSTYTDTNNYLSATERPFVGMSSRTPNDGLLNGYIDDLRVTRGYARYTTNFAPPTAAFSLK
jgi:hypothetical protein